MGKCFFLPAALQYNLPSTWDGMQKRGLGPELLAKWWSAAPAKLAGIDNQKGFIAEGLDADFVVRHYCKSRQRLVRGEGECWCELTCRVCDTTFEEGVISSSVAPQRL